MRRLNFLDDEPWDEAEDDKRVRWFGHPFAADHLGASLIEYRPHAPGGPMHMHYGVEEMFFVLSGTPTVRTPDGEEELSPGDVVYFPEATVVHSYRRLTKQQPVSRAALRQLRAHVLFQRTYLLRRPELVALQRRLDRRWAA